MTRQHLVPYLLATALAACDGGGAPASAPASGSAPASAPASGSASALAPAGGAGAEGGAGESAAWGDEGLRARLREVAATARDASRSEDERRQALAERARLLGKDVPPSLRPPPGSASRIAIELPDGEPFDGPLASGVYVLSTRLDLADGRFHDCRKACTVTVRGDSLEIRFDAGGEVLAGTCDAGRFRARGYEAGGAYVLEGQAVGPGKLAGRVTGTAGDLTIQDGRWTLERVR